ncbi:hypothetical protein ACFXKR_37030 [Streptomyces violascens]|uniref:hypothetical protein n=1 Tax=Streptomyces violascens TaxID=67381 RepID=UPI00368E401D
MTKRISGLSLAQPQGLFPDGASKLADIRGLREQVIGWFSVALGLVVQSVVDLAFCAAAA